MRRKITVGFLIWVCFLLQSTVFQGIAFNGIVPNLLIVLTASFGFMRGEKEGLLIGFFCGLLCDIYFGDVIGFYSLVMMYIGFLNGKFSSGFYPEDIKLPLVLIGISELVYGLVTCFCIYVLRGDFEIYNHLFHIILPELVYTILATLVLYQIILYINKKLEAEEQRSASKFV